MKKLIPYFKLTRVFFEVYDEKIRRYKPVYLEPNNIQFFDEAALIDYCKNFLGATGKLKNTEYGFFFPKEYRCTFSRELGQIELFISTGETRKIIEFPNQMEVRNED